MDLDFFQCDPMSLFLIPIVDYYLSLTWVIFLMSFHFHEKRSSDNKTAKCLQDNKGHLNMLLRGSGESFFEIVNKKGEMYLFILSI